MTSSLSERGCNRCTATTKDGKRCTRETCKYGPMCAQHTQIKKGLLVEESQIKGAGNGLYTLKPINKGEIIERYTGKKHMDDTFHAKYTGDTPYATSYISKKGKEKVVDAYKTNSTVARYANDACAGKEPYYKCKKNNARLLARNGKPALVATEKITRQKLKIKNYKGQLKDRTAAEIYAQYGHTYWKDFKQKGRKNKK